jgi:ATP-dependent DNA helicase RecQ
VKSFWNESRAGNVTADEVREVWDGHIRAVAAELISPDVSPATRQFLAEGGSGTHGSVDGTVNQTVGPMVDRQAAEEVLRRLAGPRARLRDDQWSAIDALVGGRRRVLLVQRTGFGKSAVYFVATALLRRAGAGPTVIVSPLLALMRNQVEAAGAAGIRAATINSANVTEWNDITKAVSTGDIDVLLVSPERLNNPEFRDEVLPELAGRCGLLVVDEAHCISDWGHDFRPDYRRIRTFLASLADGVPVLATTATANERVAQDVAEQLGSGALVLRGPLDRESLRLGVLTLPTPAHRLAWLSAHLRDLPGSGIVYTLTVSAAEEVAGHLRDQGYAVVAYSGRTEATEREQAEADLLANRIKALVATSALGMGFDKPDLGFVVHMGAPPSPIAYYQQVGRAGRAVPTADVMLLPGAEDEAVWRYFASLAFPARDQVERVLAALSREGRPLSTQALEARVDLRRSRLELMLKVLDVDGAVRRVRGGWESTGSDWTYDGPRYARVAEARATEASAMRAYLTTDQCRLEFLRERLDDPYAGPCGRCDNCAGAWYHTDIPDEGLDAARQYLGRPGVEIEPRRLWPTGGATLGVRLSGKIAPAESAETGRALGRLSDLGWGGRLREFLRPGAADVDVPDDVFRAIVRVLAAWDWAQRPVGVVAVGSRSRPRLVGSLARRLAQVGRLQWVGELPRTGGGAPGAAATSNSIQRLAAVHDAFAVPNEMAATLSHLGAPILLVDDMVASGWTMTVAARLLRRAGAQAVLPLAIGIDG